MIHMDTDGFANHARGHGIKNPFDFQGTAARHFQAELAMVHEAFTGECLQGQLFLVKAALAALVQALGDLIQYLLIIFDGCKISMPSQLQGLIQAALKRTMGTFNRTVFMAHAAIITRCLQVVMGAKRLIRLR